MKKIIAKFRTLSLAKKVGLGAVGLLVIALLARMLIFPPALAHKKFVEAYKIVPNSLLEKVIQENYEATKINLEYKKIKALEISNERKGRLYIFEFNNPNLCGVAGCLYVAYTTEGKRILNLYLQPYLPDSQPLFAVDEEQSSDGFPCLLVSQLQDAKTLLLSQYCYSPGSDSFIQVNQHQKIFK